MRSSPVRVKLLSTISTETWLHQLPNASPVFKNCEFIFNQKETDFDWLVVYEDLPREKGERFSLGKEEFNCHKNNTILFTSEPSSIKTYGYAYTSQFGQIVTSQPYLALPHKNRIYSQASLFWFYGVGNKNTKSYEKINEGPDINSKSDNLSVVWSNKKQLHTIHHQRIKFLQQLRDSVENLSVYGRGEKPLDDKAEALDAYKYHIAIENHIGDHHWTEKLADSYLGLSLPFYYGCPNINDYFPEDSYIAIDIFKPEKSISIIKEAIANNEYEKRLSSILLARDKLVQEYNIFAVIDNIIKESNENNEKTYNNVLLSRRTANRKNILWSLIYVMQKFSARFFYFIKNYALNINRTIN